MENDSNENHGAKLASPPSGINTRKDATNRIIRVGRVNEHEQDTEPKDTGTKNGPKEKEINVRKAPINENQKGSDNPTGNDNIGQKEDFGKTFRCSAKDALQKAISLAKASESSTETPSKDKQPSIEVLRDLINQNPGEFWQGDESTTEKVDLVFEQNESVSPQNETVSTRKAYTHSSFRAKRRKLQQSNRDNSTTPNKKKEGPSLEDIKTLRAVRALLEESLHNLPLKKPSDLANNLLERFKLADDSDDDSMDGQEFLARKVTLSFARDLSEILKAIKASDDSTQDEKQPAVEASLLCDEEDIAQLRDDGDANNMEDDDDDDLVEISQHENYSQQHLMCHEETELFGKPSTEDQTNNVSDRLVSQKVALLRETNRLIRSKALVLTKRRLAIQEEDDISVVI